MPAVRAVTFDAGRTLIHWWTYTPRQFSSLCRLAGLPVPPARERVAEEACARFWEQCPPTGPAGSRPDWWRRHNLAGIRAAGIPGEPQQLVDRLQVAAASLGDRWVLDPDVPAVLDVLKRRGMTLAVVSNADGSQADRLARLGIAGYFDFIADSGALGIAKPDPEIYHLTCRRLGVAPGECLHVGDRFDADVAMARAAGAAAVLYDPLRFSRLDCPRVGRLMEIASLVGARAN